MWTDVIIPGILAIIIVALVLIIFSMQFEFWLNSTKAALISMLTGKNPASYLPDEDLDYDRNREHMNDPKVTTVNPPDVVNSTLDALGYTADAPWDEVLKATELDPSTYVNQQNFVKEVRRFSSGSNFTSVNDEDQSFVFTNFVGLRRPQAIPGMIGSDARQVPDIDESVLTRNKGLIF
jgi:hypothetical protein